MLYISQVMKAQYAPAAISLHPIFGGMLAINGLMVFCMACVLRKFYHSSCLHPLSQLLSHLRHGQAQQADSAQIIAHSGNPAIQEFSHAITLMLEERETTLEHLHLLIQQLLVTANAAYTASKKQSDLLDSQPHSPQKTAAVIRELALTAAQISEDITSVADVANETVQLAEQGQQAVLDVVKSMEDIRQSSQVSSDKTIALGKQPEHVNDIVKTIDRIIEDTKLIAFNATIEAARAKDEGRGFGVVALEIKRLAEEVFESTEDIKELIHDIQKASYALVLATEEEMKTVRRGAGLAEEAGISLRHMYDMIKLTTESAHHIASVAEQQKGASAQALHEMEAFTDSTNTFSQHMKHMNAIAAQITEFADGLEDIIIRAMRHA